MRNFEKRFNRTRRLISIFFIAVFAFIIGWYVLIGVVGVSIVKDPENAAEKVGEFSKKVKEGWDQGFKVEHSDEDSIEVDHYTKKINEQNK